MDISAQKQQYQALQAARAELVESAVTEIASHLEGLDPDVCEEILAKLHRQLTGRGMSTVGGAKLSSTETEQRIQEPLKSTGESLLWQARIDTTNRAKASKRGNLIGDPVQSLDKAAILQSAAGLWK